MEPAEEERQNSKIHTSTCFDLLAGQKRDAVQSRANPRNQKHLVPLFFPHHKPDAVQGVRSDCCATSQTTTTDAAPPYQSARKRKQVQNQTNTKITQNETIYKKKIKPPPSTTPKKKKKKQRKEKRRRIDAML